MGLLEAIAGPVAHRLAGNSVGVLVAAGLASFIVLAIVLNVLKQLLLRNPGEPPVVFHWIPVIGSTISYGIDPYKFFFSCREKYGDVFTFILLGKKTTVCLGTKGSDFILNGKHKDVNAEEIYSPLTTPVFGKDVVYDCPNSKLMEQKKLIKFGLTSEALRSYVPLMVGEAHEYIEKNSQFQGDKGTLNVTPSMSELVLFTASRSLQGKEVRGKFDSSFANLYHDLDMGFSPINFMLPWAPLPHNRRRDAAHQKMEQTYLNIINDRRAAKGEKDSEDMIWNLMSSQYKDGTPLPDIEVAHMMIALLMAGQHSSASTLSWILLHLATRPDITKELLQEQVDLFNGGDASKPLPALGHDDLAKLSLHTKVVRETLRIHSPIHSILRKVTSPLRVEGTAYVIPVNNVVLASPGCTARMAEHFPDPLHWEPHRWDAESSDEPNDKKTSSAANVKDDDDDKIDYGYGLVSKGTTSPYLPFGAGRHRCIGEQFAYVQLQTLLATLVREFKFKNLDGQKGVVETDYSSLFSQPMRPAIIQWEKRKSEK
ncbi:MAG: Sterol 14-alpha demethylase [Bathelium mastoideum]|nr:MAG: Sterol 14-alpha demethylase [Bathelium mastoideum]KAI9693644.1 MAG: Sterol 14-alpha demethylase [Bathelium mastoideum]